MEYKIFNQNVLGGISAEHAIANRKYLIKSLIKKYDPDICGFQECNPWSWRNGDDDMVKLLYPDYVETAKEYSHKNCTPLFYKKDKFDVLTSGWILFDGLNAADSKSLTYAVFKDKANKTSFCCISTHFWWRYDNEKDNRQRERNAEQVYAAASEIIDKFSAPVIVMGDFNSGTGKTVNACGYNKMLELGFKDERFLCEQTTDSPTWHEYPVRGENGDYCRSFPPKYTMDFFFSLGGEKIRHRKFQVLTEEDALISSDHCPLVLTFSVHGNTEK